MSTETNLIQSGGNAMNPESVPSQRRTNRSIFAKYSDSEKASILWKFSLAATIMCFTLSLIGLALDRYDFDEELKVNLDGNEVTIPSISIGSMRVGLGVEGCYCPEATPDCNAFKFDPNISPLHEATGMSFAELASPKITDPEAVFFVDDEAQVIANTFMGSFDSMHRRGMASRILAFIGVGLQGLALVWSVVFRVGPSPFFYNRPLFGQSVREHYLGAIYLLMLILSGIVLFASNTVMSTFVIPLLARIANFALSWCKNSPFDSVPRQQTSLKYMLFLGDYIQGGAETTGVTFITFAVSISLVFAQAMFVAYLGISAIHSVSRIRYHLPPTQHALLPWYAKIPSLAVSITLLVLGVIAKCGAAYSARVRGYDLNMFFYKHAIVDGGTSDSNSWSLPDLVLDDTQRYVMDKSLVKMLLALWIPSVTVIGFATIDLVKYLSKVIQILGILFLIGGAVSIVTVPPTPAFVLQKPQCYRPPVRPPSFAQFFYVSESCNDQIFSMYSVLILVPAMMFYFYIRYGPITRKLTAYVALFLATLGSLYIIISTRQQYTVDVYIGALITVLVCLSQAAPIKLLFRFGMVHLGISEKPPVVLSDKIVPMLDDVIKRLELHFMAGDRAEAISKDDMDMAKAEFERLSDAIAMAKQQSLQTIVPSGLTDDEGMTSVDEDSGDDIKSKDV